jgi:hypothetical protein
LDCDRMALAKLTEPQRNAYAPALFKALKCPVPGSSPALVPFFRHRHEIHTRILTIMKPARSVFASFAALLIIPALSVLTLTTAGADEDKPATEKAAEETPLKQRDGEVKKEGPRDGERKVLRDERDREVEGDGEMSREAMARKLKQLEAKIAALEAERAGDGDGARKVKGPRDGEARKEGPRDGEQRKLGLRDGDATKEGARDGDGDKKKGPRDGEVKKEGARDGDGEKKGPRDGEVKKEGARDGDRPKEGQRDGE